MVDDENLPEQALEASEQNERPSFDKAPFVRKHLDTDVDIISMRLNREERAIVDSFKDLLNVPQDATIIKLLMMSGRNVLLGSLGEDILRYLASQKRVRRVS